jgi:hypothetical protein
MQKEKNSRRRRREKIHQRATKEIESLCSLSSVQG